MGAVDRIDEEQGGVRHQGRQRNSERLYGQGRAGRRTASHHQVIISAQRASRRSPSLVFSLGTPLRRRSLRWSRSLLSASREGAGKNHPDPVQLTGSTSILNQYQGGMCISGRLTRTERTPRHLISPLGPNWVGTDSAV